MEGYRSISFRHILPASQGTVQRSTSFLVPSEKNCLGWVRSKSCMASFTSSSSANWRLLRAPFRGPNKWEFKGARSKLYAGWSKTSNFCFWKFCLVWEAVWGQALFCKKRTTSDNLPCCFVGMAGLTSFHNLSQYIALVTVIPHSW
jgi:hypothetical protein